MYRRCGDTGSDLFETYVTEPGEAIPSMRVSGVMRLVRGKRIAASLPLSQVGRAARGVSRRASIGRILRD